MVQETMLHHFFTIYGLKWIENGGDTIFPPFSIIGLAPTWLRALSLS
jgi:hypothetical protein